MSDKKKFNADTAGRIAREILALLAPFCEPQFCVVAGSLRRGKPTVGDIEILYVPRFEDRQIDMFTSGPMNLANEKIGQLVNNGTFSKRPNIHGSFTYGDKNKLLLHRDGIPVDLFATTKENWWVSLVVRTGSKETNLALTTGANAKNLTLNAYGSGVTHRATGVETRATSEQHVFELCGVKYKEPEER